MPWGVPVDLLSAFGCSSDSGLPCSLRAMREERRHDVVVLFVITPAVLVSATTTCISERNNA